jgi:hypothetical protein
LLAMLLRDALEDDAAEERRSAPMRADMAGDEGCAVDAGCC